MKEDKLETRGRPRNKRQEKICDLVRAEVAAADFHQKPRGHMIRVEAGKLDAQIHCSFSYKELRQDLAQKGLKITAYNKGGKLVLAVRKS